ncbi:MULTISPECIES: hypothetical protein [unclassified Chryseobacterium]|nr:MULTISPECIES: hypothetical protein [unclassified Chryseobacterium]
MKTNGANFLLLAPFCVVPITEEISKHLVEDLERISQLSGLKT